MSRLTRNEKVPGSIPGGGPILRKPQTGSAFAKARFRDVLGPALFVLAFPCFGTGHRVRGETAGTRFRCGARERSAAALYPGPRDSVVRRICQAIEVSGL